MTMIVKSRLHIEHIKHSTVIRKTMISLIASQTHNSLMISPLCTEFVLCSMYDRSLSITFGIWTAEIRRFVHLPN